MKNVSMSVKNSTLTITIDLGQDFGPSTSGKTKIVATSEGNADVPGHPGVKVGVNVFKK